MASRWKDILWPFAGTLFGLLVVPIAIAQYPDFFNENRWLLPVLMSVVAICWLLPLFVHKNSQRLWGWIVNRGGGSIAIFVVAGAMALSLAVMGWIRLFHYHEKHLASVLKTQASKTENGNSQSSGPKVEKSPPNIKKSAEPRSAVSPLHGTEQFVTYVMWSPAGNYIACPNNMNPIRISVCLDVREFSKGHVGQDVAASVGTIFQRYFVALMLSAGEGWGSSTGPVNGHWSETNMLPIEPPECVHYVPSQLLDTSNGRVYPWWFLQLWNEKRMKLPKDTTIGFFVEPSEEHRDSYLTRFERKGYYRLDVSAYSYGAPQMGVVPDGYEMQDTNIAQLATYRFVVREDWELQRSHAPTFAFEDYDRWAKELFTNIHDKLAN
jgi:hypothetical protein